MLLGKGKPMRMGNSAAKLIVTLGVILAMVSFSPAEGNKGRWRFEFQVGSQATGGKISSPNGNTLNLVAGEDVNSIDDPRPDEFRIKETKLKGRGRLELHASYGFGSGKNVEYLLDFGIGYAKGKLEGIQLSYSLDRNDLTYNFGGGILPGCESVIVGKTGIVNADEFYAVNRNGCVWVAQSDGALFRWLANGQTRRVDVSRVDGPDTNLTNGMFQTEVIDGGDLKTIPITAGIVARYRPTKRFSPYLGGSLGYMLVSFKEASRWKEVADQLNGSVVSRVNNKPGSLGRYLEDVVVVIRDPETGDVLDRDGNGVPDMVVTSSGYQISRPRIDAPNTMFLEVKGGFELQISPKASWFAEAKFFWAQKRIRISVDDQEKWGSPTPELTQEWNDGNNPNVFPIGGKPIYVIKGGILVDDVPQSGEYYLNGGTVKYGGFVFGTGVKITF